MWFNCWLAGFLGGLLATQFTQLSICSPWLAVVVMPILCYRRQYLWLLCGYLWGASHNAPFPPTGLPVDNARGNLLNFFTSDLIVNNDDNYYRIRGQGDAGIVKDRDLPYLFFRKPPSIHNKTDGSLIADNRDELLRRGQQIPQPVGSWITSITLGIINDRLQLWPEAFKLLGLFHIVVISGLHITIVANSGRSLLNLLVRSLYVVRIINPALWLLLSKKILVIICSCLIGYYGCLVGFSAPAQRAVILFVIHQCLRQTPYIDRIRLAVFLQTLLFPIGFCSDSLLLSWAAYLCVVHCLQQVQQAQTIGGKLRQLVMGQLVITLLVLSFFAELSVLTIPLNLILVPLLPVIVVSGALLLVVDPAGQLAGLIWQGQAFFLEQIVKLSELATRYRWLTIDLNDDPLLRIGILLVVAVIILSKATSVSQQNLTAG